MPRRLKMLKKDRWMLRKDRLMDAEPLREDRLTNAEEGHTDGY